MAVKVDLNISLDGFATTTDQTPENPFGDDWQRLVAAYTATRTFRERVMGETSGEGTNGIDEKYASTYFEGTGAEIMGAGMFGLHQNADDPDWRGWWGEEPPFHTPCVVLTHHTREPLAVGETTFHFMDASPADALAHARELAPGTDVRIGGGATTVREFLEADLIDYLHLVVSPVLLGRGSQLWGAGLEGLERRFDDVRVTASPSGVTHIEFERAAQRGAGGAQDHRLAEQQHAEHGGFLAGQVGPDVAYQGEEGAQRRRHRAAIKAIKGLGRRLLLADDEARPILGVRAQHHLGEAVEDIGDGLDGSFGRGRAGLYGGLRPWSHLLADRGGDMLGGGDIQALLAAEMIGDRRHCGARGLGDVARAGAFEAQATELVDGGVEESHGDHPRYLFVRSNKVNICFARILHSPFRLE